MYNIFGINEIKWIIFSLSLITVYHLICISYDTFTYVYNVASSSLCIILNNNNNNNSTYKATLLLQNDYAKLSYMNIKCRELLS